ncbi:MAG: exosortase/archaeosortase family protein [Planctomycetes bacterium]|nr:exosortase/archaeosortase family protein [Planctomycetota bacterium]
MSERLCAVLILLAAGVILTSRAWTDIVRRAFHDPSFMYVFMVPAVFVWLVYVRRLRLRRCRPRRQYVGYIFLLAGAAGHLTGIRLEIDFLNHLGAMIGVIGCFLAIYGTDFLRSFAPAFIVLMVLVPLPAPVRGRVASTLELMTVGGFRWLSEVTGVPATGWGEFMTADGAHLSIQAALDLYCMAGATFLLATAFAFGQPFRGYVRMGILLSVPLLLVVCNSVRLILFSWGGSMVSAAPYGLLFHVSIWCMLLLELLLLNGMILVIRSTSVPVTQFRLAYQR